jgi:hypothetical protein
MRHIVKAVCGICASALLAACTASGTPGPTINAVDPNYGKLQFAVGTANLYGTTTGLNVASTMRQPNGHSAYGVDTPQVTGPFTFAVGAQPANGSLSDPYGTFPNNGPSLPETSGSSPAITGTPQTVHPGTPFCDTILVVSGFTTCPPGISPNATTFGESGGVFAMGLAPYNTVASTGQSYSYQPFPQPLYENAGHFQFVAWGGPPAFDPDGDGMGTRDGLIVNDFDSFGNPFFLGVGEGVSVFEGVTAATGSYTMSVQIAIAGPNGPQILTKTTTASLNSLALLPTIAAPLVTPDGTGGANFNIAAGNFAAPMTEALVQIIDYGPGAGPNNPQPTGLLTQPNCQGPKGTQFAPVYFTFIVTATGAVNLGNLHGPNTNLNGGIGNLQPSPSICTQAQNLAAGTPDQFGNFVGDNITVQIIGFDYPDYEAAHSLLGNNVPQAPSITGANGQADITVSIPEEEDYPGYTQSPLLKVRHPLGRLHPHIHPQIPRSGSIMLRP